MQSPRPGSTPAAIVLLLAAYTGGFAATVPVGPPAGHRGDAWPPPLRTLWVDRCGRGDAGVCGSVACSDGNSGVSRNAPLCTLGKAGDLAQPGDLINVRPGRSSADGYWEQDRFRGKVGHATLAASVKGTATCAAGSRMGWGCTADAGCPNSYCDFRPIVLKAYEADGAPVHIDPSGRHPADFGADQCWTRTGNYGRYVGLAIGGVGSCDPPQYGGVRNERAECYGGPNEGKPCASLADCGAGAVACDARPWYWIVDGFHFTGWHYYDARLDRNDGNGSASGNQCSEKATQIAGPGLGGCPVPVSITLQNNTFTRNGGGGVVWAFQAAGMRYFNNRVEQNYTRGYTTVVNHWSPKDAERNRRTYMWGNVIGQSYDDPPPWAHAGSIPGRKICRPADPGHPPTLACIGGDTPGAPCREETDCGWGHCGPLCAFDPYYNTAPADQGFNCECRTEWVDWDGDPVVPVDMCAAGLACVAQRNTGGGGEPSGNTEGRGIIVDRGYTSSAVDIRNNVIYDNAGDCISMFLSDGGNAAMGPGVIANNTCYHNAKKGASFTELNVTARHLDVFNNLIVPRPQGTCKSGRAGGRACTTHGQAGGICGPESFGCSGTTFFQYDNVGLGSNNYAPALPGSVRNGHELFFLALPGFLADPVGFEFAGAGRGETRNARLSDYMSYGVQAGLERGVASIAADPLFASTDPKSPEFLKVRVGSPALGSGHPAYAPPFDREGNPRDRNAPTLGAYELPMGTAGATTTTTTRPPLPTTTTTTTTTMRPPTSTSTTTTTTRPATTVTTTTGTLPTTTTVTTSTTTSTTLAGGSPWFGTRTAGAQSTVNTADNKRLSPFPLAESGTVTRLVVLLASVSGGAQEMRPVVYRDAAGEPGALVAAGPPRMVTAAAGGEWIALPFTTPVPLAPGIYWLGTISGETSRGTLHFIGTTAGGRRYGWDPYADGASDPAGAMTPSPGPISIYAEYTRTPAASTTTTLATTSSTTTSTSVPTSSTTTSTSVPTSSTTTSTSVPTSSTTTTTVPPDGACSGSRAVALDPRVFKVDRFRLLRTDTGYVVTAEGNFPFSSTLDPGAVGVGVTLEDGAQRPVLDHAVAARDFVPTRSGWRLAAPLGALERLDIRARADSAGVTLRGTVPLAALADASGTTTTASDVLRWRIRFGQTCAGSLTVTCTDDAQGNRTCRQS